MNTKRVFSLILSVILLLSVALPMQVFADDIIIDEVYDEVYDSEYVEEENNSSDISEEENTYYQDEQSPESDGADAEQNNQDNDTTEDGGDVDNVVYEVQNVEVFASDPSVYPEITTQPQPVTVAVGETATFSVVAVNAESYQWYYMGANETEWHKIKSNGTSAEYNLVTEQRHDGNKYCVVVKNANGSATSETATLTVKAIPVIKTQPTDVTVAVGETATFSVVAENAESYQWYYRAAGASELTKVKRNGTSAEYSLVTEARHNGNSYCVVVTNADGSVTSEEVLLTVDYNDGTFTYSEDAENNGMIVTKYLLNEAEVTVPNTFNGKPITQIGASAFEGKALTTVHLPDTIKIIGTRAFANCTSLTNMD